MCGLKQNCSHLVFIAIIENDCSEENVKRYYSAYYDKILFFRRITEFRVSALGNMLIMLKHMIIPHRININCISPYLHNNAVMISQSPSIDSVLLCNEIKRKHPNIEYIQYWGDPIALSLITPEEFGIKRLPFYYIEQRLQKYADKIIYGTKSLYDAQIKLFKRNKEKMAYCDVSFCSDYEAGSQYKPGRLLKVGYFGGYYKNIRDITPLYDAFVNGINGASLVICGDGDVELSESECIQIKNRVPQIEVSSLENNVDVYICILNRVGIQIPGKVFYLANTEKIILVILDGKYKTEIYNYLSSFRRFVFCNNDEEDIERTIRRIRSEAISTDKSQIYRLTPKYVASTIINGGHTSLEK